jgi:hypothetical protein
VLHLSGYGNRSVLELEDEDGNPVPTNAAQLADSRIAPVNTAFPLENVPVPRITVDKSPSHQESMDAAYRLLPDSSLLEARAPMNLTFDLAAGASQEMPGK